MFKRLITKPGAPVAAILACTIGAAAFGEQSDAEKKKAEAAADYLRAHGWAVQKPGEAKKSKAATEAAKKAADADRKLHESFWRRWDEAWLEQMGAPVWALPAPPVPDGKTMDSVTASSCSRATASCTSDTYLPSYAPFV